MRLMGIGETSETQSDLLLCPSIVLDGSRNVGSVSADVLVTNPLRGSPHILTMDYLLHRAPCLLRPKAGRLEFQLTRMQEIQNAPGFQFFPAKLVGGAFAVPMNIGGVTMLIVVDTGAAAALSLGKDAAKRLKSCRATAPPTKALQGGVNGEKICSNILETNVVIGALDMGNVPTFANSHNVQSADGYAGMGLLRALDIWLEPSRIGLRRSGLPVSSPSKSSSGMCDHAMPACAT